MSFETGRQMFRAYQAAIRGVMADVQEGRITDGEAEDRLYRIEQEQGLQAIFLEMSKGHLAIKQ